MNEMLCIRCKNPVEDKEENFGLIRLIDKETRKPFVWKRPLHTECAKPSPFVQRKLDAIGHKWDSEEDRMAFICGRMIPGPKAWKLYGTHGVPLDIIIDHARDYGLKVNVRGFFECMEAAR